MADGRGAGGQGGGRGSERESVLRRCGGRCRLGGVRGGAFGQRRDGAGGVGGGGGAQGGSALAAALIYTKRQGHE